MGEEVIKEETNIIEWIILFPGILIIILAALIITIKDKLHKIIRRLRRWHTNQKL